MKTVAKVIILLALGAAWPSPWARADQRRQPEISELEVNEDGLAILRVVLHSFGQEGARTFRFALDTGAVVCVLDPSVPESFFWDDSVSGRIHDANGARTTAPLVSLKRIEAGGMVRDGVSAVRIDLKHGYVGRFQDQPVDGLLGMSFLEGTRFLLDMEHRQIQWWGQARYGAKLPLHYGPDKAPRVSLRVGTRFADCLVDTGMLAGLALPWSLRPKGEGTPCLSFGAASAGRAAEALDLPEVGAGGHCWRKVPVLFQQGMEVGNIGMEILAAGPACFDFLQHQLTLPLDREARLPLRPRPIQKLVLAWNRSGPDPRLAVEHVFPGSAEDAAGLQAGDEIIQVGALKPPALSRRAIQALVALEQPLRWLLRRNGRVVDLIYPGPARSMLRPQQESSP